MFARKQLFHYFNVESKYGSIAYRLSLAFALNSSACHVFDSCHCPLYKGISSEVHYTHRTTPLDGHNAHLDGGRERER